MRRIFPAFAGVIAILLGLGIISSPAVFSSRIGKVPLTVAEGQAVRIELDCDCETALSKLGGKELWRERIDENLEVVYGYTERIGVYETVHGQKVNIMIAISDHAVSLGVPLLTGSY